MKSPESPRPFTIKRSASPIIKQSAYHAPEDERPAQLGVKQRYASAVNSSAHQIGRFSTSSIFNTSGHGGLQTSANFAPQSLAQIADPSTLQSQLTKEQEINSELKKQMRNEKAQSDKAIALLEQQIALLRMQLEESTRREKQQKEMSERVISAFQQTQPSDSSEDIRSRVQLEVEAQITEDHPKVRGFIEKQSQQFERRIQEQKEKNREEVHALEKKLQQAVYEKESSEKEFKSQKSLVQQLIKEKDNTISQLNIKLKSDCDLVKEHYKSRVEHLETQL